jgi:hypothetical protein
MMNTNLVANAQVAFHPAYQQWIDKMLAKFATADVSTYDDPNNVASFIYTAATDDSKKLHYLSGNRAINTALTIEQVGIDKVLDAKEQFLFSE